jgi:hypothetical protein
VYRVFRTRSQAICFSNIFFGAIQDLAIKLSIAVASIQILKFLPFGEFFTELYHFEYKQFDSPFSLHFPFPPLGSTIH